MTALSHAAKTQSPQSYLYTRVVSNNLGETAAIVVSSLISYGRSTTKDISSRSRLPPNKVKVALVSLIQLNCVFYWHDGSAVYYSFNEAGAKCLIHAGDVVTHIKAHYGEPEAEVMQNVLENGNVVVKDFVGSFGDPAVQLQKMECLLKLHQHGWLRRLQAIDYQPVEDLWDRLYQDTMKQIPRNTTTSEVKRVAEGKARTKTKLDELYASGIDTKDVLFVEDGLHKLRPHITLTFNLARYEKALRSRALVNLANSRLGLIASSIYNACCSLVEQHSPDLTHPYLAVSGLVTDPEEERMLMQSVENKLVDSKLTVFSIRDVARTLPRDLDLRNSILTQNFLKPAKRASADDDHASKRVKLEDGAEPVGNGYSNGDDTEMHSLTLLAEHLRLLSQGNIAFLFETAPGSYTIPYLQLAKQVKQFHHDLLIKTTLGPNAFRVLRCIKEMKLVDEKAISNSVLLKERTVKNEVYRLVTNNVVEIQEVPRSADRAASKTFYLFRHREFASFKFVSKSLVYAMADILSNVDQFKSEHKILLDKCEREDVKGHEEELLLESELKMLRTLQLREVNSIGRFNRVKWLHFIFESL